MFDFTKAKELLFNEVLQLDSVNHHSLLGMTVAQELVLITAFTLPLVYYLAKHPTPH